VPNKIYFYRMTTDNGGAPCIDDGLWSLAICKPRIRMGADPGDVVVGFAGNDIDPENGIIHTARVTKPLPDGEYYDDVQFHRRSDCIYRRTATDWKTEPNPFHGPSEMATDLGARREHTRVLLSDDFRYFGNKPFRVAWSRFPLLREKLDRLTKGERVNHSDEVRTELDVLLREAFARPKVDGEPTHKRNCPCNRDDDEAEGCAE